MKVRPSVKPICEKCKIIRRKGRIMVICEIRSISRSRDDPLTFVGGATAPAAKGV